MLLSAVFATSLLALRTPPVPLRLRCTPLPLQHRKHASRTTPTVCTDEGLLFDDKLSQADEPTDAELLAIDETLSEDIGRLTVDATQFEDAESFADAVVNFAAIDKDGNGVVTAIELRDHLNGCGHDDDVIDEILSTLGMGFSTSGWGSGMVTLETFAKCYQEAEYLRSIDGLGCSSCDAREQAAIEAAFDALDADSDGELSLDECRAQLEANSCTTDAVDAIFATLDLNSDGGVSREEWTDACARYSALRRAFGICLARACEG